MSEIRAFVLVSGDFVRSGGMDMANFALASYLARNGARVHLVTHRAADDLAGLRNVVVHRAPKPAGSDIFGAPFLDWMGRAVARKVAAQGGRVVVNGGNCAWGDVNWVHYVHAAWCPATGSIGWRRVKDLVSRRVFLKAERTGLRRARLVITNSSRTRHDVVERLGIEPERVRTVYYGTDPDRFKPASANGRARARTARGWDPARPVLAFVGALGDRRKGFDLLFAAWTRLCADTDWDVNLAVVGAGAELPAWRARARTGAMDGRIDFLGFQEDVPAILTGCDALILPARYEAYGLAAHEALCCGLPAFVPETAGVAERYPMTLRRLLIADGEDPEALVTRLREWRAGIDEYRAAVAPVSDELRRRSWDHMAAEILTTIEAA